MVTHLTTNTSVSADSSAEVSSAEAGRPLSAGDAWKALGGRTRRYIIMQHGQIDLASARDACDLPWEAVRDAIEGVNDEFNADGAEQAIVRCAAADGGGLA